jgi:hypothetical protein
MIDNGLLSGWMEMEMGSSCWLLDDSQRNPTSSQKSSNPGILGIESNDIKAPR